MSDSLLPIREAIKAGDKTRARELLRPLLKQPTAEIWYLAAYACESRDHARQCLNRALVGDPNHQAAKRALHRLESTTLDMPPLEALVEPVPATAPESLPELLPRKPVKRKKKGTPWGLIGCGASILLSLTMSYIVLTYLGSPIVGQVISFLNGEGQTQQGQGTPVFGSPANAPSGGGIPEGSSGASGGEGDSGGGSSGTSGESTTSYFVVQPSKTVELKRQQPVSDVLDAGKAHEYTFEGRQGQELAIGIQFLSPSAKNVGANVAVLDPDGHNAESACQRDSILTDGSSVAFICKVYKSGTWKLQVFGRDGESTGVYVVTFDRM